MTSHHRELVCCYCICRYEVLHAHVVYGQPQRLTSACEATIIDAMQATLGETHSLVAHRVDSKFELAHDT